MAMNSAFANALQGVTRGLSQAEVSERTGISPAYVSSLVRGHVPSYRMLHRLAEGLRLGKAQRTYLFTAANFVEPEEGEQPLRWPPHVERIAEKALRLSEHDAALVESLADRLAHEIAWGVGCEA